MGLQIRSEIKTTSPVERELAIIVPGTEVAKELDKAYRALGMKVRIKGFRPGKVPRYVLEQYYKQDTERQVVESIVGAGWREAVKSHELQPVANPNITVPGELIPGMDFSFQAKVEVRPVIDIKAWKGLSLKKTTWTVADEDIDHELNQLREAQARVAPVEDRTTVQQGDLVELNWSGSVDGEHVKGLSGVAFVVEVGAGNFFKEAEQALVGKNIGDSFSVDVAVPDDHRIEAARGKTAQLQLRPLGIKKKTLPALDDEFAKDVAEDLETLDALKARIRESLETQAKQRSESSVKDAAVAALIEQNPFDVPSALVERQSEQIAVDRLSRLPQRQAEMIWESQSVRLKEDARPQALRQVRISLILEELIKLQGVEISDNDVEEHFEKLAKELNTDVRTVKGVYKKGRRLDELRFQLQTTKMLDQVVAEAKVEEEKKSLSQARA